jgi:hypothetical protein
MNTVLVWAGGVTVLAGVAATLWRGLRAFVRIGTRMEQFMDDWYGEEARPGIPARPGVLERVGVIESRIERVEHEMHPNSGASLRDAVDQANHQLSRLCRDECDDPALPPAEPGPPPDGPA